ncbi:Asp23/Gls24 family envelope stress response protein [Pseudonocardia sp. EC080625-04]|uniref:Asp23/Gls24 family envelope stress response protein n=1 Tax=Pseudonocardia sp. EC080625-04 TaxID=1096868 RepID=UPI0007620524|nr:Asp23/Gls24 family envelope stress response protein [Pseudonocardia sp. EC080625-04]
MTALAEPDERGSLDVDPSVLRKIVEYAADTAPATRHRTRRVAGLGVGESGPSARVTARTGDEIDVRLWLTLVYPGPVRAAAAQVRERIAADLLRMTGHRLHRFTVEIGALQSDRSASPETARVQ